MAFNCPKCGAVTYTKTSKSMSSETRRSYHQCQNLLCGCSFTTITSVEIYLTKTIPKSCQKALKSRWISYLDRIGERNRWRCFDGRSFVS
ncbi:ogr/Delta-like zinc finger family protein [Providencia sp. PROV012]|uniref:ogr/Delta-like zinc finger family protein n=1 Tax=Providencia sp. PROV012 TaxID=2936772 RepID=UPI00300F7CE9